MAERQQWSRQHANPAELVYVGRARGAYGKWGNPFSVERTEDPTDRWGVKDKRTDRWISWHPEYGDAIVVAVDRYRRDLYAGRLRVTVADARRELRDRDLGCWCRVGGLPCHGDVLLEAANS